MAANVSIIAFVINALKITISDWAAIQSK